MKNLYLLLLAFVLAAGSTQAQNSIVLDINHQLSGSDFALYSETEQSNYVFTVTRLQYYISDIAVTHDGGTVTEIENVWILVNANGTGQFELGDFEIENVEGISFYVGVGMDVNHDDPAAWPSSHPLYPQSPSMHWGWSSGYRFVAFEGNAGAMSPNNMFQLHALGDNNYFQTNVVVFSSASNGQVTIPLNADYTNSLNGINLSSGVINHGTAGESIPLLQNFSTEVFSAPLSNSVENTAFKGEMTISPNPSSGAAALQVALPVEGDYVLKIVDLQGREVQILSVNNTNTTIQLPELVAGVYLIELIDGNKARLTERWVVE